MHPLDFTLCARARRIEHGPGWMALSTLNGDAQGIIFNHLCNVLDPGAAVAFSSVSSELRKLTQAERQLKADHEAAAALGRKVGKQSCKELREAKLVAWALKGLSADDLALLGRLGLALPALETLALLEPTAGPDGVQRLAVGLGAGALPAVNLFAVSGMHVGDAGASELAAALGRGALPRLKSLTLENTAIGDAGLLALAPALRRLPALEIIYLGGNLFRDEGLAAFRLEVDALPEEERKLVVHCGLEGLPLGEVAERLGISTEAAGKRWQRLRARLAESSLPEHLLAGA